MALKQFLVPLDDTMEGLSAFRFVLENFGWEHNMLNIIWLGENGGHSEKAVDVKLKNSMVQLNAIKSSYRRVLKEILEQEFSGIFTQINVISIHPFTRKGLIRYCNYSDILFSTFSVYQTHIYPLFKDDALRNKYAKVCCPKILVHTAIQKVGNIVMVNTGNNSSICTMKQFCHVFSGRCHEKELNILDLQKFDNKASLQRSQRPLVAYLKNHISSPAIFPYSEEDEGKLAAILNITKNTLWVSPLESVAEVKFISKKV